MDILNKLTIKHLLMNKRRTIVTVIGVILSTALMVGVGLMISSFRDNMLQSAIKYNGEQEVTIKEVAADKYNVIKNNVNVEKVFYSQPLSFAENPSPERDNHQYILIENASNEYLKHVELVKGRMPKNNREIIIDLDFQSINNQVYQLNDQITLQLGKLMDGKRELFDSDNYIEGEAQLHKTKAQTYTIVGIYQNNLYQSYSGLAHRFFTKENVLKNDHIVTYIKYHSSKNTYPKTEKIVKEIGNDPDTVHYNDALLSIDGQSRYRNVNQTLTTIMAIVLGLISIACIIVIYNSFNISVMERKKQFGLFSSIGATARQLRKTVFFEAAVVGLIGIPIGILSGYLGIAAVIHIINVLMPNMLDPKLGMAVYPIFVILPIVFMIVVILISAYLPARKASHVTPIEAIRQNDDIKIRGKKIKTRKWIKKIFGIEGDIALKNIKRNKKKYRITVISLFISMVLFIVFSGLLNYGLYGTEEATPTTDYDAYVSIQDTNEKARIKLAEGLKKNKDIKKSSYQTSVIVEILNPETKVLNKQYREKFFTEEEGSITKGIFITKLDEATYRSYQKEVGATDDEVIFINYGNIVSYRSNSRLSYAGPLYQNGAISKIAICNNQEIQSDEDFKNACNHIVFDKVHMTEKIPFGMKQSLSSFSQVIVSEKQYQKVIDLLQTWGDSQLDHDTRTTLFVSLDQDQSFVQEIKKLNDAKEVAGIEYYNVIEQQKMMRNMILVIKILLYGFIGLVTLIGITSVFNTISTSLALRKKEFAMLRSIGLTPKGFKKILWFESLFFVLKALLYALPVSFLFLLLIHNTVGNTIAINHILIPYDAVAIAIIFSFVIVLITTIYSTRKMRKENILEAIREENI